MRKSTLFREILVTLACSGLLLTLAACGEEKKTTEGCPAPLVECGDECVNLRMDTRYCSDTDLCGVGCGVNETCNDGVCTPGCGCVIDGVCLGAGQVNPMNSCLACVPETATDTWTATDGAACDDGLYCTTGDACVEDVCTGGAARDCDDQIACNGTETCDDATAACLPGTSTCTGDELCDVTSDACVLTCTGCVIDGLCYGAGQVHPENSCLACVPETATDAWTATDGAACDDGLYCTTGDACVEDVCTGGAARDCDDQIACNGTETCDDATAACLPGTSTCGADELCDVSADACVLTCTGCVIEGLCYGAGQGHPENTCLSCDPLVATDAWSGEGCFSEGRCYRSWDALCSCPITLQTLRDDYALLITEVAGTWTCYNQSDTDRLMYGFYRPGCSAGNCGGWMVSVGTYPVWDYNEMPPVIIGVSHMMSTHDGYNGPPPPSRTFENMPLVVKTACQQVLTDFKTERGCP